MSVTYLFLVLCFGDSFPADFDARLEEASHEVCHVHAQEMSKLRTRVTVRIILSLRLLLISYFARVAAMTKIKYKVNFEFCILNKRKYIRSDYVK